MASQSDSGELDLMDKDGNIQVPFWLNMVVLFLGRHLLFLFLFFMGSFLSKLQGITFHNIYLPSPYLLPLGLPSIFVVALLVGRDHVKKELVRGMAVLIRPMGIAIIITQIVIVLLEVYSTKNSVRIGLFEVLEIAGSILSVGYLAFSQRLKQFVACLREYEPVSDE